MSSVQQLSLHAGGGAAVSDAALDATTAFHVVLAADGSVAIERSHDEEGPAAPEIASRPASGPALSATLESPLPALHGARPSMRGESAPSRQLRWSFAGGALAATVALVTGYQLFERWSEAATASRLVTNAAAEAPAPPRAPAGPPAAVIVEAPASPSPPPVAITLPAEPPAAGRPVRAGLSAVPRDVSPPALPPGVAGPCTAAVAALGLCTLAPIQERP